MMTTPPSGTSVDEKQASLLQPTSSSSSTTELLPFLIQEARAVSLWSCLSLALRLSITLLILQPWRNQSRGEFLDFDTEILGSDPRQCENDGPGEEASSLFVSLLSRITSGTACLENSHSEGTSLSSLTSNVCQMLSTVNDNMLLPFLSLILPSKVTKTLQAPGFFFGNSLILFYVYDKTKILPSILVRTSEFRMGRLSAKQFCGMLPIHFICMASAIICLQQVQSIFPSTSVLALEPIDYSSVYNGESYPWIVVSQSLHGPGALLSFFFLSSDDGDVCIYIYFTNLTSLSCIDSTELFQRAGSFGTLFRCHLGRSGMVAVESSTEMDLARNTLSILQLWGLAEWHGIHVISYYKFGHVDSEFQPKFIHGNLQIYNYGKYKRTAHGGEFSGWLDRRSNHEEVLSG